MADRGEENVGSPELENKHGHHRKSIDCFFGSFFGQVSYIMLCEGMNVGSFFGQVSYIMLCDGMNVKSERSMQQLYLFLLSHDSMSST